MLIFTDHARKRMSQRNFTEDDIYFILDYAEEIPRAGAVFYCLHRKDIPKYLRRDERSRRLDGATVVVCKCSRVVLTMYYPPNFHRIKRNKMPYSSKSSFCQQCRHY